MRDRIPVNVRRSVTRRLPGWALYRLRKATSYLERPLDPAPLERIAAEPLKRLQDASYLEHELLPALGFTSLEPSFYPPELQSRVGRGVQPIQLPNQFGPYLAALTSMDVRSYVEIGVEHGGAFAITVEVLRRFGLRRALAVEIGPKPLLFHKWMRPEVEVALADSQGPEFKRRLADWGDVDLALIDADHSYESVLADFETVRPYARMLAFHDIVEPFHWGVREAWREIREAHPSEYTFTEFTAQYPHAETTRAGIGLAVRRPR